MRILVTGHKGMLGSELLAYVSSRHEALGIDIQEADLSDPAQATEAVRHARPDVVVHTAAFTDVDGCESQVDTAYRVNAIGTRNVALACRDVGAVMLYMSTDYVFNGRKREPYTEFDPPDPLGVYARTKLAGEQFVRDLLDSWLIVRTSWLAGRNGKNFVETMLGLARKKQPITVVNDQIGTPTFVADLVPELVRVIQDGAWGLYHISSQGACSWFDYAVRLFELAGLDVEVKSTTTQALARPAPRPAYSVLRNYMLELTIGDRMPHWEDGLRRYLGARGDWSVEDLGSPCIGADNIYIT